MAKLPILSCEERLVNEKRMNDEAIRQKNLDIDKLQEQVRVLQDRVWELEKQFGSKE